MGERKNCWIVRGGLGLKHNQYATNLIAAYAHSDWLKWGYGTDFVIIQNSTVSQPSLKAFRANQGLLLADAVAYYALLSLVPMMILTVGRYLEWLVPGQSGAIVVELDSFLAHREVLGWVFC